MSDRPRVSVVIPVRNDGRFLGAAIESVLNGSYQVDEIIVVDNASEDGSAEVAQSYPVRYVHHDVLGQASTRNAGIAVARGDVLAFLDADDRWTPDKLARQLPLLEADPGLDFVLAHMRAVLAPGVPPPSWLPAGWLDEGVIGGVTGVLVARRSVFDRVGLFNPDLDITCDTDWIVRAQDAGLRHHVMPEVLLLWRLHGQHLLPPRRREAGPDADVARVGCAQAGDGSWCRCSLSLG